MYLQFIWQIIPEWDTVAQFVESLLYKSESRWCDSRGESRDFSFIYFGCIMALRPDQPLTKISTRNLSWK